MPDAFTPNLALVKPEVGASRDSWGAKWNTNADALDQFVSMAAPIGMIVDFAGPNAPPGYLICDGRWVSRTTYSALFAVIGTWWGAGDGSTTFALPNLNGRSAIGPGTVIDQLGNSYSFTFTAQQGIVYNLITQATLPNYAIYTDAQGGHNHGYYVVGDGAHTHGMDAQGVHNHDVGGGGGGASPGGAHTHTGTTDTQGTHTHTVQAWATSGGGSFASPGGAPTNGGVTTDPAGAHSHNLTIAAAPTHQHFLYWDGGHTHTIGVAGHTHAINWDGNHAHTIYLGGGGQGFEVLNPVLVVTKIIYAGQQAVVRVLTAVAPTTLEGHDELAAIREELAQLRALVGTPSRRLLSAPLRGSR